MLLYDIGKSPDSTFKGINRHLKSNYGFSITESVSDEDLVSIMEQIEEEITDLKIKGKDSKHSPEISKRLLILEGLRNLREFTLMKFQSPDLESVIEGLSDYVNEMFCRYGECEDDFESAIRDAMNHYRSSKYRFPDDTIERRVRDSAMGKIQGISVVSEPIANDPLMMEDEEKEMKGTDLEETMHDDEDITEGGPWDNIGKRSGAGGGHAASAPKDDAAVRTAMKLRNTDLALEPEDDRGGVKMVRGKDGRMVPDPFAAHAAARRGKGTVGLGEKANLVKNLRRLLETEVSQAEVMMAAKGFAQELQEMVEKIGRLQNEDLPPVTDQMRETYGTDSASTFQTQIYGALQGVMDSLYTAKGQVDDAVSNMATTGQVGAEVDMDKDLGDVGLEDPAAMDADIAGDLDNIGADLDVDADLDAEIDDEFGGADEEEPLGRAMKAESHKDLSKKVLEMKRLVAEAKRLKESKKRA